MGGQGPEDQQPGGGPIASAEGGVGLYLGELRVMLRRLLKDEDIYNTVRQEKSMILYVKLLL